MWERRLERLPTLAVGEGACLVVADRATARMAGLAGMRALPPSSALLIPRCRSVHTIGMRFALDLIWLDGSGRIVDVSAAVGPGRIVTRAHASAVVECQAGSGAAWFATIARATDTLGECLAPSALFSLSSSSP